MRHLQLGEISQNLLIVLVPLEGVAVALDSLRVVFVGPVDQAIDVPAHVTTDVVLRPYTACSRINPNLPKHRCCACRERTLRPFLTYSYASSLRSRELRVRPFMARVSAVRQQASSPTLATISTEAGAHERCSIRTSMVWMLLEHLVGHLKGLFVHLALIEFLHAQAHLTLASRRGHNISTLQGSIALPPRSHQRRTAAAIQL